MKPRKFLSSDSWFNVSDWLKSRGKLSWFIHNSYYVRDLDTRKVDKMKRRDFVRFVDAMRIEEGLEPFLPDSKPSSKPSCQPE